MRGVMYLWTIYRHAADMPDHPYCVRRWEIGGDPSPRPAGEPVGADSLEQARALVGDGADECLARALDDDPCIVETWI